MSFLTCCSILFTSCWLTSPVLPRLLGVSVNVLLNLLLNPLHLLLADEPRPHDPVPEPGDGVPALPDLLHLVPAPVGRARVGHGVPVVPVGGDLVHKWPILLAVVQGEPGGLPHGEDVHPVDLKAWYVVPSLVEV